MPHRERGGDSRPVTATTSRRSTKTRSVRLFIHHYSPRHLPPIVIDPDTPPSCRPTRLPDRVRAQQAPQLQLRLGAQDVSLSGPELKGACEGPQRHPLGGLRADWSYGGPRAGMRERGRSSHALRLMEAARGGFEERASATGCAAGTYACYHDGDSGAI
jgi:hypothetical protein